MPEVRAHLAGLWLILMELIREDVFRVIVKPSAKKSEVLGYDGQKKAYRIAIAAQAQDNKANLELVKFLSRELGKKVRITSGHTAKMKMIKIM